MTAWSSIDEVSVVSVSIMLGGLQTFEATNRCCPFPSPQARIADSGLSRPFSWY